MIPGIKAKPSYTLNIPKLSGGMNLRDGISLIQDDQLTDCQNMWFKDGMLRTRPRVRSNSLIDNTITASEAYFIEPFTQLAYFDDELRAVIDGQNFFLETLALYYRAAGDVSVITAKLKFDYISEIDHADKVPVGEISFTAATYLGPGENFANNLKPLTIQHNGDIYCFVAHRIIRIKREKEGEYAEPELLSESNMYVPLVATNCLPAQATDYSGAGGNMINGYNLLTGYYKVNYSMVDKDAETTSLCYLPLQPTRQPDGNGYSYAIGKKVTAEYTDIKGNTYSHEVTIGADGNGYESKPREDDLIMSVYYNQIYFTVGAVEGFATLAKDQYVKNNLTITAPGPHDVTDELKVFNMTVSAWFGGTFYGIYGGSRLFLGGNTSDTEKALVVWSDLNNPLYFSENNYAYVGDKSQAVTAFGKQADNLVIFKEREIYQTQYVSNGNVTAEELINQSEVDLSTLMAYFPLAMVHGYIGCDCPDTVQLCRNRLVWANSDGKVYTLVTQSQYNERSVFEISEMIDRRLKTEKNLQSAHSADYDGHYVLVVDNHMYVMDYNSYGYNYVYSYSKTEDANLHIPWYYWEIPIEPYAVVAMGEYLLLPVCVMGSTDDRIEAAVNIFYIDGSAGADEINMPVYDNGWTLRTNIYNVQSLIQTKLFDFNQPAVLKSVPIVNFSFGYNRGEPIYIEFLSERQIPDRHTVTTDGAEAQKYSPEFMHSVRLFPYTKGTVRFGARITCDGELLIDSMSLQYKALGGAK